MFRCSFLFIYSRGLPITVNRALNNLDSPGLYISSQCLVSDFQSMFMGLTLIMDIPPALANSLECQLAHGSHVQCPVYTWIIHCDIIETKICYNYVEGIATHTQKHFTDHAGSNQRLFTGYQPLFCRKKTSRLTKRYQAVERAHTAICAPFGPGEKSPGL